MIRVLIVAEVRIYRDGLADLLARNSRLHVVGAIAPSEDLVPRVLLFAPNVVLLDTSAPNSLHFVADLARQAVQLKVIALALADTAPDILRWLEAGVAGYVPRDGSLADLVATVDNTVRWKSRCSAIGASTAWPPIGLANPVSTRTSGVRICQLTAREQEILELIGHGMSNKEIARQLCIVEATTKNHVHHILEKLRIHRRAQAIAWIHRHGSRLLTYVLTLCASFLDTMIACLDLSRLWIAV